MKGRGPRRAADVADVRDEGDAKIEYEEVSNSQSKEKRRPMIGVKEGECGRPRVATEASCAWRGSKGKSCEKRV